MALFFVASVIPGSAQKADAYIHDIAQVIAPYGGRIDAPNCHQVNLYPASILTKFVLVTGLNEQGEPLFNVYAIDVLRVEFDLSDLNEDKILNGMHISSSSLAHWEKGTPLPPPDLAVVLIPATSPKMITVHAVPDNVKYGSNMTESEMGVRIEQRKGVDISFPDKDRADAFVNALKKAIIACKAQ